MGVRYVLVKKKKKVDASKAMTVCKVRNDREKKRGRRKKRGERRGGGGGKRIEFGRSEIHLRSVIIIIIIAIAHIVINLSGDGSMYRCIDNNRTHPSTY